MHIMKNRNASVLSWIGVVAVVFGVGRWAWAAEEITACSIPKGGMTTIEVPFAVKGVSVADKSVIRIETENAQQLRVIGLKEGSSGVQVTGDGNAVAQYNVTVIPDIAAVLGSVRKLLEEVPGVEARIDAASGKVLVSGDVVSLDQWTHLEKVVALYAPQVLNFAKFNLTPEAKQRLMDAFEKTGLKVVEKGAPEAGQPGVLTLQMSRNSLIVSGTVLNKNELGKIDQILSAHQWMIAKPGTDPSKMDGKVVAMIDVGVDSSLIEVGVAFVGMRESDFSARTGNLLQRGLLFVSDTSLALQGKLGKDHSEDGGSLNGQYNVGVGLNGALKLLSGDGGRRTEKVGHLTLKNNAEGASFRDGGTIKVRVSGQNSGDLKDIAYGINLQADGYLKDASTVELKLNTSVSLPMLQPNGDYDVSEQKLENVPVSCKLGQTLILAGSKQTMELADKSGVPFLRQIPVINWFTSDKATGKEEIRLLILVSPQYAAGSQPGAPMSEKTRGLLNDMTKPLDK
jgi:Flp pilus assembly secretin CpaC